MRQNKKEKLSVAKLKHLGSSQTIYQDEYNPQLLEAFDNRHPAAHQWVSLICTEFTSLCPKTGQPDFARIYINYVADKKMVESKSLKLYLFSFRNHGDFHENCIQTICNDLAKLMEPKFLEVVGHFTPRGGISIFPYSSYCSPNVKDKNFQKIKDKRQEEFSPGKYSLELSKLYN